MKKVLLGAAAILAVGATAGVATADTGVVGVHVANADLSGGGDDIDFWGLNGGWNHEFGNGWTIQADGQSDRVDFSSADIGTSYGSVAVGTRNANYSVYGFVGLSDMLASSGLNYGVGGQLYFSNFVVGGSVGHVDFEDAILPEADVTSADLNGAWYFTPNFGVTGELGWAEVDLGGSDGDWESYGLGAVWRFSGSPISIDGRFRHDDFDGGEVDAWLIGVNLNFGTATAQEQATQGPSWNGARNVYEDSFVLTY